MNLTAIKGLCFGGKRATIYNEQFGGQWISNGFGAYLVEGIRIESAGALMELWNLSDKARDKAVITVEPVHDLRFTEGTWPGEEELVELGGILWGDSESYIALRSVNGLLWISAALLKPLRSDYRQYYARWDGGKPLIAVYENMVDGCKALILPVANVTANSLQRMAEVMRAYSWQWPGPEDEAAEAEAEAERVIGKHDDEGADIDNDAD